MSPMRVQHRLETWRAAERERDRPVPGTPDHASAEAAVSEVRAAYLVAVRVLAERDGTSGIDRVPGVAALAEAGLASELLYAADKLQREATDDQRAARSDQVVSDADQRESDADLAAARDGARRPAGDTQAQSEIRRLASSATRDKNADARDATADERGIVIDRLFGVRRPN